MGNDFFTSTLLRWYDQNGRSLPWRETSDPYAIWLSEIILQQTRIAQGTAYWQRFMQAYPTVEALAHATEDEILRLWQGLGYYSRARNLHQAAQQIMRLGHFPSDYETIRQLKGVGDYTAAAIASLAFGLPYAAVDGNVYRVLSRYFGIDTPIDSTQGRHLFHDLAQSLLPKSEAGKWNQALMDFGAMQCTPQNAACETCPLAESCEALRSHKVDRLPVKQGRVSIREREMHYVYLQCGTYTALHRRGAGDIWQGLWEPLQVESQPKDGILRTKGITWKLTHQTIHATISLKHVDERPALPDGYLWIKESDITQYALPRMIQRLLDALLQPPM